ncbi:DUF1810 domain-containing protein [Sphingobium phenoxybenzoativorans]|uniref:DUF1810 domain-containing protein n=1 Tax=Sphingobium phenoxybenzoativorans TaxID=1592790 RepID=UPI0008721553|nr:DUF1810 domain-containing protein [Sphingobium phenoxybenzoativorans]
MTADTLLNRFLEAQATLYEGALDEIRRGVKRSHWMWFIFPQLKGLGRSPASDYFGIANINEARAYLDHAILGERYREAVAALQALETSDPVVVFGQVDAMKLCSSLTLFEAARPLPLFTLALDRWFDGSRDQVTLERLDGAIA